MESINIKGKDYIPVNERIKEFRTNENYKNYKLISSIVELNEGYCVVQATILNEKNEAVATGLAREVNGDSYINKTSFLENCETSAFGRALGCLGIGVDVAFASANEIINATHNQPNTRTTKQPNNQTTKLCPKCGSKMREKNGKKGKFLGCSNYPNCNYTENISQIPANETTEEIPF